MIWALHGFLGSSRDWDPFREAFEHAAGTTIRALDLLDRPVPEETPAEWGARFARAVRPVDHRPIVIGYSMGGRLALHALLADPSLFAGAVVVSAGLGVEGEEARQARRVRDDKWAFRFETEPWDEIVPAWNAQPLFAGAPPPRPRSEEEFSREALATALRWWSPAVQKPLAPFLPRITTPVLWIAGERDAPYVAEAKRAAALLPACELWIAGDAGHRVPWEVPDAFAARVEAFLPSSRA